jgi:ComB4 competence protein
MLNCFFKNTWYDKDESDNEYNNLPESKTIIPYCQILDDHITIISKKFSFSRIVELKGFDNIAVSSSIVEKLSEERIKFFNQISDDFLITLFTFKKKNGNKLDIKSNNSIIDNINKIRKDSFGDIKDISIYIQINQKNSINPKSKNYQTNLKKHLSDFNNKVNRLISILSSYKPRYLENTKDRDFELSRFLSYKISNDNFIHKKDLFLDKFLSNRDITFYRNKGLISFDNKKYSKIISIFVDVDDTIEDIFKNISSLDIEFDIIQNIITKDKNFLRKKINDKIDFNSKFSGIFATSLKNEDLEEAKELIEAGQKKFYNYSCYLRINSDSKENIQNDINYIIEKLQSLGISYKEEVISIKDEYLSSFVDYEESDNRQELWSTENISDFFPIFSSDKGFNKNSWGDIPVVSFKTITDSLYNFNFHESEKNFSNGNTLCIGSTSSGKSTLIAFLLMNCLKYPKMKILGFDSREGLRVPIEILGGNYQDVSNPTDVKLNPFSLPNKLVHREFLNEFLSILIDGADLNEKAILDDVIRINYELFKNGEGNLKKLISAFGNKMQTEDNLPNIAKRIEKWVEDKDLKQYFNHEKDNLDFSSQMNFYDMGDILENSKITESVSSYIFHKFYHEIKNNPSPHIYIIDELARYLENKNFIPHIKRTLKEVRKQNGIFIGCVQELSTIINSNYIKKDEFINNIATFIIFPNPTADRSDYEQLNINDNEFDFIINADNQSNNRQVLIKKNKGKSIIIDIDLSILGNYLKVFSSSAENLDLFKKLKNQNNNYLEEFLKKAK